MMPIVMMWHLGEGQPTLGLVCKVQVATDARMLLKTLKDTENMRYPEGAMVKRAQNLCSEMSCNMVDQVLQPMVLVGVTRQGMSGPMMDRMKLFPQERINVVGTVPPIHTKRHDVMVEGELQQPHRTPTDGSRCCRVVARHPVVDHQAKDKLAQERESVMKDQCLELGNVSTAKVSLGFESMLIGWLCSVLRKSKIASLQIGIVHPCDNAGGPIESCHFP